MVDYFCGVPMMFCMGDVYRSEYQILLVRLRQARKAAHLTQAEVAARLGRTQGYVNKIETGERRMDVVQLRDFCGAVGVDFVEFIQRYDKAVEDALRE
jgi:transcriptional regulator with XRE-family HTH domain